MSSPNKLSSEIKVTGYDFDPDATTATEIGWVDMRDFDSLLVAIQRTVGTSALTLKIMGNPASNGGGTDVDIVSKTFAAQPDAVGDIAFLETDAREIAQKAAAAGVVGVRYVTAVVSAATATDEAVVTYIRRGKRQYDGLTSDIIA